MAATSIVRLSLESAQYEQRLRSAKRQFEDFTKSIGINIKQLTAAGLAIGAATAAINTFTSACSEAIARGTELAKEGEGIKRAFDRLNQPNLLDNLRKATHDTVSDLELMKNAVKFDNFNLSLEQMGTFLAFAQKQAKDTGQSVDYMVESIVTGLGRKSLPILDNLGLSATDIRERMKETGDMTTAVADIIKERMEAAGGYVETAADRAAQQNAMLQNKMEELGRKFLPVKEASDDLWTSIKIGILDIVGGPLADLLSGLTRAGQLRNELKNIGSNERVNSDISKLRGSNFKEKAYTAMLNKYSRDEQAALDNFKKAQKGGMGSIAIWENRYLAQKAMREDFQSRGREVLNGGNSKNTPTTPTPTTPTTKTKTSSLNIAFDSNRAALAGEQGVDTMPSVWAMIGDQGRKQLIGGAAKQFDLGRDISKKGTTNLDEKKNEANLQDITNSVGNILGGLENIGIEIPKGFAQVFGVLQTITAIVAGIQALQEVGTFLGLFANGGVAHAANGLVPGRSFSGDNIPAMLNSGETVLTRAQSSNLVSMLNNNGMGNLQLETYLSGEDIRFVINNNGRRTGVGEMVTSKVRRI